VLKAVARVEQYVRGCSDRSKSGARYLLNSKVEEVFFIIFSIFSRFFVEISIF
jgi:hypothetical protein